MEGSMSMLQNGNLFLMFIWFQILSLSLNESRWQRCGDVMQFYTYYVNINIIIFTKGVRLICLLSGLIKKWWKLKEVWNMAPKEPIKYWRRSRAWRGSRFCFSQHCKMVYLQVVLIFYLDERNQAYLSQGSYINRLNLVSISVPSGQAWKFLTKKMYS